MKKKRKSPRFYSRNLEQKQITMGKAAGNAFGHVILCLVVLVATILLTMSENPGEPVGEMLSVYILIGALAVSYLIGWIRRLRILNRLYRITNFGGQETTITCKRVRRMVMSVSKHRADLVCVIFVSNQGQRYFHIQNKPTSAEPLFFRKWSQFKNCEMTLICYKDTNIVKELPTQIPI